MLTIIHYYIKSRRERERGKSSEERSLPHTPASVLRSQAAFHITSELQITIHLLQTHDNIVRNQKLKYSNGLGPPQRERERERGWEGEKEEGEGEWGVCWAPALPVLFVPSLLHPTCLMSAAVPRPCLFGMVDWHLLCREEGTGSYWQHCHVHLHTLWSSSVATNTKRNLLSSMTSLGMEYLSLQMIALLPVLDMVLANMCNCWKCNDDYLHI